MKTKHPIINLLFCTIFLICLSCNNSKNEINSEFAFQPNLDSTNVDTLAQINSIFNSAINNKATLQLIGQSISSLTNKNIANNLQLLMAVERPSLVNVKDSIAKLFDPDLQPCPLPENIVKKLKKYKDKDQAWVPKDLVNHLKGMPDKALYFDGKDVPLLLHTIKIKHSNNLLDTVIVLGSPTIKNLDVTDFIWPGINNFGYTLDCSGLLSASIQGTLTVPGSDITTKAGAAFDQQKSMFVGGGVIISPLYAAFFGESSGVDLSKELRSQILKAITEAPGVTANDAVELVMSYEVVWASSKGEQGFNGSSNLAGKGAVGIGIAQASSNVGVSGTVSRKSNFSSFETYVTGRQRLNAPAQVTIASINAKIAEINKK